MTIKQATLETLATILRNRYVLLAVVILGTIGPGIVKLSSALRALQH